MGNAARLPDERRTSTAPAGFNILRRRFCAQVIFQIHRLFFGLLYAGSGRGVRGSEKEQAPTQNADAWWNLAWFFSTRRFLAPG